MSALVEKPTVTSGPDVRVESGLRVVDRVRTSGTRRLDVLASVTGALAEEGWALYLDAFEELRTQAAQRHVMTRAEFDDVLADGRIGKYVVLDEATGRLAGMSVMTRDLEAMPLVSPEFFAARWPEAYAAREIFYLGFMAVHPDYQGAGVFAELVWHMTGEIAAVGGICGIDICARNEKVLRLPRLVERLVRTHSPGTVVHRLDEQVFWAYELPRPRLPLVPPQPTG